MHHGNFWTYRQSKAWRSSATRGLVCVPIPGFAVWQSRCTRANPLAHFLQEAAEEAPGTPWRLSHQRWPPPGPRTPRRGWCHRRRPRAGSPLHRSPCGSRTRGQLQSELRTLVVFWQSSRRFCSLCMLWKSCMHNYSGKLGLWVCEFRVGFSADA